MTKRLSAALALVLSVLSGCAAPPSPGVAAGGRSATTPLQEVEALPEAFATLRRAGPATDYESRPGGAGLGASVNYRPANGERVNVTAYVYDRGRPRAPEGGAGPDVGQELREASAEINRAVQAGLYRAVAFEAGIDARLGNAPSDIRCATFRVVQRDGAPTGDSVCLTVQNGRFLKLRVTVWNPPEPAAAGLMGVAVLSRLRAIRAGEAETPLPAGLPRT